MSAILPVNDDTMDAVRATDASLIGRTAIRSLYSEVALHPKPGLVSPVDNGSHHDMTMATFMRSLFALRHYFPKIAAAGHSGFEPLRQLGLDAERRMLAATDGVNTHRGAIFNLGLLAAAAGFLRAAKGSSPAIEVCDAVAFRWGCEIMQAQTTAAPSNGTAALARHGGEGARQQAAAGFPLLKNIALPIFKQMLQGECTRDEASVQTLFTLMSELNDTNVLHRAGADGLVFVRAQARSFLAQGGVRHPDWRRVAEAIHQEFVRRRISPGGAADLLACTMFLHDMETAS